MENITQWVDNNVALGKTLSKELSVREEWWWCYVGWRGDRVSPFAPIANPSSKYLQNIYEPRAVHALFMPPCGDTWTPPEAFVYLWYEGIKQRIKQKIKQRIKQTSMRINLATAGIVRIFMV